MTYWMWLVAVSAAFVLLERLRPARPEQRALRPQLANDLAYLAFNGYFWAVLTGGIAAGLAASTDAGLERLSWLPERGFLAGQHFAVQFAVYLVVRDFLQWTIHILLHRVPLLWQFHKVHHSIKDMDWAGNFRFHWMELVVYNTVQYVPLLFLGGDLAPLFTAWIVGTAWGHFNHANIDVDIGRLGYLFNSPRMHLWHHDASSEGGTAKNFGIVLSCWDYLFGTAWWPRDRAPETLGYAGDEEMPRDLARQAVFPLARSRALHVALLVVLVLHACASLPEDADPERVLPGSSWQLVELDGMPVEGHSVPVLELESDQLGGSGGCNRYSASFELSGTTLHVGAVASTRRACEPRILDRETRYLTLLGSAQRVELVGEFLAIHCDGAHQPLRFARWQRAP